MPVAHALARPTRCFAVLLPVLALVAAAFLAMAAPPAEAHRGATRWDCLAHHESTHRWRIDTGNGHYGGLQFSLSTWRYYGGPRYSGNALPNKATRREQIAVAKRVAWRGWKGHAPQGGRNAWPNTWYSCF